MSLTDKTPCCDCRRHFASVHTDAETAAKDMNADDFDRRRHPPMCSSARMRSSDTSANCDCRRHFASVHTDALPYARHAHARHPDCTCNTDDPPHTSSHETPCPHSSSKRPQDRPRAAPDTCAYVSDTHSRCQLCNSARMRWLDKRPSCGCPPNFGNAHTAAAGPLPDTNVYVSDTHSKSQLCNSALMRSWGKRPNCGCHATHNGESHTLPSGRLGGLALELAVPMAQCQCHPSRRYYRHLNRRYCRHSSRHYYRHSAYAPNVVKHPKHYTYNTCGPDHTSSHATPSPRNSSVNPQDTPPAPGVGQNTYGCCDDKSRSPSQYTGYP